MINKSILNAISYLDILTLELFMEAFSANVIFTEKAWCSGP